MTSYDLWLMTQAEKFYTECKPCEDRYGDLNCCECDDEDCEYWDIYHDKKKGE